MRHHRGRHSLHLPIHLTDGTDDNGDPKEHPLFPKPDDMFEYLKDRFAEVKEHPLIERVASDGSAYAAPTFQPAADPE